MVEKVAVIGGEQDQAFEQAFSSLAYTYLKDKAPRLLDFIVGFQLVDRNDDNTKAVGVFGAKVGKQWFFLPAFFLNGDLKGHELLYIKQQDTFVPLEETWVNYLMARKPYELGDSTPEDTRNAGGRQPDLSRLAFPPSYRKFGEDAVAMIASALSGNSRFLYRDCKPAGKLAMQKIAADPIGGAFAELDGKFDLRNFLTSDPRLAKVAADWAATNPGMVRGFARFYGKEFLPELQKLAKACNTTTKKKKPATVDLEILPSAEKAAAGVASKLRFLTSASSAIASTREKKAILQYGYAVRDKRAEDEVSRAFKTDIAISLNNPERSGIYSVLETSGACEKMVVLASPKDNVKTNRHTVVFRLVDGNKDWINVPTSGVYVKQNSPDDAEDPSQQYRTWWDNLGSASLKNGGVYIAVSQSGEATSPFEVADTFDDENRYRVNFMSSPDCSRSGSHISALKSVSIGEPGVSTYGATLVLNERSGSGLRAVGSELYVPSGAFKIVELKKPSEDDNAEVSHRGYSDSGSAEPRPISPGNLADVHLQLNAKTSSLKIKLASGEAAIFSARGVECVRSKEAAEHLVRVHGFRIADAEAMLKEAAAGVREFRVIYGPHYPMRKAAYSPAGSLATMAPVAPGFPAPYQGMEQIGYGAVNTIYPQEEGETITGIGADMTDPQIYDPFYASGPDRRAMGVAQQAADAGQREVFDTAILSSMLGSVREDTLVDKYLGDLMKAVDRLGRMLFVFYWHGDKFEDRYGRADMPAMEDSLRNAFSALGELVLFLKEKDAKPDIGFDIGPDVDESAAM